MPEMGVFDPASINRSLVPYADNVLDLGESAKRWRSSYLRTIDMAGNLVPDVDDTRSIGTSTKMLYQIYTRRYRGAAGTAMYTDGTIWRWDAVVAFNYEAVRDLGRERSSAVDTSWFVNTMYLASKVVANATTTLVNSPSKIFRGSYWDGVAAVDYDATILHRLLSTTPTSELAFQIAGTDVGKFRNDQVFVLKRVDVGDYGGAFATYTPPSGEEGAMVLAVDTNVTAPGQRLYAYVNGVWRYTNLT